jgi:hypothetical protein
MAAPPTPDLDGQEAAASVSAPRIEDSKESKDGLRDDGPPESSVAVAEAQMEPLQGFKLYSVLGGIFIGVLLMSLDVFVISTVSMRREERTPECWN